MGKILDALAFDMLCVEDDIEKRSPEHKEVNKEIGRYQDELGKRLKGEGTGYADLTYTCGLNDEEYGVGFRKGSDLANALNDFFASAYADGSMMECAETYGVQAAIIEQ